MPVRIFSSKPAIIASLLAALVLLGTLGMYAGKAIGDYQSGKERKAETEFAVDLMKTIKIGDRLPDHVFENLARDTVRLSRLVAKGGVVVFVSGTCESCKFQLEELSRRMEPNSQSRFVLITADNPRYLEDVLSLYPSSAISLYDHHQTYWRLINIKSFPLNVAVDSNLMIIDIVAGGLLAENMTAMLGAVEDANSGK